MVSLALYRPFGIAGSGASGPRWRASAWPSGSTSCSGGCSAGTSRGRGRSRRSGSPRSPPRSWAGPPGWCTAASRSCSGTACPGQVVSVGGAAVVAAAAFAWRGPAAPSGGGAPDRARGAAAPAPAGMKGVRAARRFTPEKAGERPMNTVMPGDPLATRARASTADLRAASGAVVEHLAGRRPAAERLHRARRPAALSGPARLPTPARRASRPGRGSSGGPSPPSPRRSCSDVREDASYLQAHEGTLGEVMHSRERRRAHRRCGERRGAETSSATTELAAAAPRRSARSAPGSRPQAAWNPPGIGLGAARPAQHRPGRGARPARGRPGAPRGGRRHHAAQTRRCS